MTAEQKKKLEQLTEQFSAEIKDLGCSSSVVVTTMGQDTTHTAFYMYCTGRRMEQIALLNCAEYQILQRAESETYTDQMEQLKEKLTEMFTKDETSTGADA